jgi:hypothetical protein
MLSLMLLAAAFAASPNPEIDQGIAQVSRAYSDCQTLSHYYNDSDTLGVCMHAFEATQRFDSLLGEHPEWPEAEVLSPKLDIYKRNLSRAILTLQFREQARTADAQQMEPARSEGVTVAACMVEYSVGIGILHFRWGSAKVSREFEGELTQFTQAALYAEPPPALFVVGHRHWEFPKVSLARAESVSAFLVGAGFDPEDLTVQDAGRTQPRRRGLRGARFNRRVEINPQPLVPGVPEL